MTTLNCIGFLVFFQCDLPPAPPPVVACPQVQIWSKEKQARLADELDSLQPGSALKEALREHIQLRDRLRKCRKHK